MLDDKMVKNLFNKIKLVDYIANSIANYGVQNGYDQLFDKIDLTCGAIPEGDISQVIDFTAPEQFLGLYVQIAENRFAMAVTEVLKMNPAFINPILNFVKSVGEQMQIEQINSIDEAFTVYENFILDGMPCDETKEIKEKSEEKVCWKKLIDTHENAWKKVEGDISVFYEILAAFVSGLFIRTNFTFSVENKEIFVIQKN